MVFDQTARQPDIVAHRLTAQKLEGGGCWCQEGVRSFLLSITIIIISIIVVFVVVVVVVTWCRRRCRCRRCAFSCCRFLVLAAAVVSPWPSDIVTFFS